MAIIFGNDEFHAQEMWNNLYTNSIGVLKSFLSPAISRFQSAFKVARKFQGGIITLKNPIMKNLFKPTLLVVLMSLTLASTSEAFSKNPRKANTEIISEAEAQKLTSRLDEIKAMDASSMTRKQKRELRHEVKAINETLHTSSGGVYVSVGALIIIILLLIILF